jgi:hypothetical protein
VWRRKTAIIAKVLRFEHSVVRCQNVSTSESTKGIPWKFWNVVLKDGDVVFLLLGESPASEFYMPTFRNTLFHIHRWCKQKKKGRCCLPTPPMKMEQCSETSEYKIQKPVHHPKEIIQHSEHGENLK